MAPRAARATAFAPCPARSRRWPGRVARAVSSVGAPRKTLGMKLKTAWLEAVATRKQERRTPVARGSAVHSGAKAPRKPIHAPWAASRNAATLFTWSPGERPVSAPVARPNAVTKATAMNQPTASTRERPRTWRSISRVHVLYLFGATPPTAPAAAPGSLDDQHVVSLQRERNLRGQRLLPALADQDVPTDPAVASAAEPLRPQTSPLRQDRRRPPVPKEPDGPSNSVASRESPAAPASVDQPVFLNPERHCEFERFNRRVARVRHVRVDARHARPVWEGALPSRDRFVVGKGSAARRPDCHVVHRPLALRGDPIGEREREGPE